MLVNERSADRVDHKVSLKYFIRGAGTWAVTANAAPGGVYIVSSNPPKPGTEMVVEVDLPSGPVRIHGVAVWNRPTKQPRGRTPAGFGVRFIEPPASWAAFAAGLPARAQTNPTGLGARRASVS